MVNVRLVERYQVAIVVGETAIKQAYSVVLKLNYY